jgi:CBS domain containing-hemolysin-like protein
MSDADLLAFLVIVLCLVGSMFFSSAETAITSFGEHQARKLMEEGGREGRTVSTWVKSPVRVLSTILVGNNLTNTLMGSVATAIALRHLGDGVYREYAVPLAVLVTTTLLLVFGEILPKAAGRVLAYRIALPMLAVLNVLGKILLPITWSLSKLTNFILRRAMREETVQRVTADEIDYLVRVGEREGSIPADQAALLQGIFRFEDKIVRDIMVPRDQLTAIDLTWSIDRVVNTAHTSGHSRLPVYEGDLDEIKGVLHIKQLVGLDAVDRMTIRELMRKPIFVSESTLIQDLLQHFRQRRIHLAVVVDDGGHTVGVVTLEDVLEQIVGQIFDESDKAPVSGVSDVAGIQFLDGQASLRRVEENFDVDFDEFDGVDSVGDLLTQLAGQMPTRGSVFVYDGIRFKVLSADDRRVIRVSVERIDEDDDD